MRRFLFRLLIAFILAWPRGATAENSAASSSDTAQVERFGDWNLRCASVQTEQSEAARRCEVVQIATVKQAETVTPIVTLAVARDVTQQSKSAPLALTILVPLNVLLPAGLSLQIDDKHALKMSYRNCNQTGCWLLTPISPAISDRLRKGKEGSAAIQLLNGQKVTIRFSLDGLAAALKQLNSQS